MAATASSLSPSSASLLPAQAFIKRIMQQGSLSVQLQRERQGQKRGKARYRRECGGEREKERESLVSEKESQIMKGGEDKDRKA